MSVFTKSRICMSDITQCMHERLMLSLLLKLVLNVKIYPDHDFEIKFSFVKNKKTEMDQFHSIAMFPFEKQSKNSILLL